MKMNRLQEIIKNIKTIFYYPVGGQFKKRRREHCNDFHEIPSWSKLYFTRNFIYPEIQEQIERIKKRTMTYIVSGKHKNKPFLMVDCVGTEKRNSENIYHFRNKLKKLTSTENETYFCLTGHSAYQHAIEAFDEKCYWNGDNFDFENISHMEEILDLFNLLSEKPQLNGGYKIEKFCRMYFINKEGVHYYNIDDDGKLTHLHEIPQNSFIKPDLATNEPINIGFDFETKGEIIEFCKNEILKLTPYNGLDLKDKFSYVIFDGNEKLTDNSMKNNKELVLSMVGGNYNEIE